MGLSFHLILSNYTMISSLKPTEPVHVCPLSKSADLPTNIPPNRLTPGLSLCEESSWSESSSKVCFYSLLDKHSANHTHIHTHSHNNSSPWFKTNQWTFMSKAEEKKNYTVDRRYIIVSSMMNDVKNEIYFKDYFFPDLSFQHFFFTKSVYKDQSSSEPTTL